MNKNIKIITLHKVFNYGSVLQTYATVKLFEKENCNVSVIDYISKRFDNKKIFINFDYEGNNLKKAIYTVLRIPIILKRKVLFNTFLRKHVKFTKRYHYYRDLLNNPPQADIYITGGDQCWNKNDNSFDPAYYLKFGDKKTKRVSFSTSVGEDNLTVSEKKKLINLLNDYNMISTREKSSALILSELLNKKVDYIIDPTLQLNSGDWDIIASKRLVKQKYLLLYLLYDEDLGATDFAIKYAHENNLKIVQINFKLKKKSNIDILMSHRSPADFLALIRDAEFIVTNSFHGLAFSVNYNKQFVVFKRKNANNRMYNFLKLINLENRLIDKTCSISSISDKINYTNVNKILEKERCKSQKFIKEIIK